MNVLPTDVIGLILHEITDVKDILTLRLVNRYFLSYTRRYIKTLTPQPSYRVASLLPALTMELAYTLDTIDDILLLGSHHHLPHLSVRVKVAYDPIEEKSLFDYDKDWSRFARVCFDFLKQRGTRALTESYEFIWFEVYFSYNKGRIETYNHSHIFGEYPTDNIVDNYFKSVIHLVTDVGSNLPHYIGDFIGVLNDNPSINRAEIACVNNNNIITKFQYLIQSPVTTLYHDSGAYELYHILFETLRDNWAQYPTTDKEINLELPFTEEFLPNVFEKYPNCRLVGVLCNQDVNPKEILERIKQRYSIEQLVLFLLERDDGQPHPQVKVIIQRVGKRVFI
jgi:hypothetical protein